MEDQLHLKQPLLGAGWTLFFLNSFRSVRIPEMSLTEQKSDFMPLHDSGLFETEPLENKES